MGRDGPRFGGRARARPMDRALLAGVMALLFVLFHNGPGSDLFGALTIPAALLR